MPTQQIRDLVRALIVAHAEYDAWTWRAHLLHGPQARRAEDERCAAGRRIAVIEHDLSIALHGGDRAAAREWRLQVWDEDSRAREKVSAADTGAADHRTEVAP